MLGVSQIWSFQRCQGGRTISKLCFSITIANRLLARYHRLHIADEGHYCCDCETLLRRECPITVCATDNDWVVCQIASPLGPKIKLMAGDNLG